MNINCEYPQQNHKITIARFCVDTSRPLSHAITEQTEGKGILLYYQQKPMM